MAGKGKKTFVAGEILLAQDVNEYLMDQSVMNFASSAARASAIPTPTEGMTTYVQDRNQIETFDGAEYRGMSGLQLVKKQAIGTGVTSVVVTDAFSATYDAYKIIIAGGVSSADSYLGLSLGASVTGYFASMIYTATYTAVAVTVANNNNADRFSFAGDGRNGQYLQMNLDLIGPGLAKFTRVGTNISYQSPSGAGIMSGVHAVATAFTGFTVTPSAGTMTGGTIYVYGYGT
jgi:hypothetical protein